VDLAAGRPDGPVRRVGYAPNPWAWTAWEYGPFAGRWDDPEDVYRVLYAASTALGCYLEVLAQFRPDPGLATDLETIEGDPDDIAYPTVPAGELDRAWIARRRLGDASLAGRYVDVGHSRTIGALRPHFLGRALTIGLPDFDASAVRLAAPRPFTQVISRFLYGSTLPSGDAPDGIEFFSRHGDDQRLWAIFERDADIGSTQSHLLSAVSAQVIAEDDPDLSDAMRIHHLRWTGRR
jgi:hypothetical protein